MLYEDNYLAHFGIKGQKWGVRRFQNEDGTLTSAGYERYGRHANTIRELDSIINSKDSKVRNAYNDKDIEQLKAYRNKLAAKYDRPKNVPADPDGVKTPEGRTRYSRGKNVSKEMSATRSEELEKLEKNDAKKRQELRDELKALIDKYELDGDDGGGGNSEKYSEKELEKAGKKFWELSDKISEMDYKHEEVAAKNARDKIIKKYGETAISDMNHYRKVNSFVKVGAILAAASGLTYLHLKNKSF